MCVAKAKNPWLSPPVAVVGMHTQQTTHALQQRATAQIRGDEFFGGARGLRFALNRSLRSFLRIPCSECVAIADTRVCVWQKHGICGHASGCGIWDVFHVFLPTLNAA